MAARTRPQVKFHRPDDPDLADVLRRDGVVLIEGLISPELVAETRQELARYQRDVLPGVPRAHWHTYRDGSVHSMSGLEEFDPWFGELGRRPQILDVVARSVSWPPELHYLESFPKPAGADAVTAHQELYTNPIDPPHFLHLWIALEDVTAANGGLTFYPGTHKIGMAPHDVVDEHMGAPRVGPELLAKIDHLRIDPDYPAGSAALFDGWMVHSSGPNRTERDRPVIIMAFRDAAAATTSEADNIASWIAEVARGELPDGRCGMDDSFFALGGDSLAAVRVLARVRERYGVRIPLGEMFRAGTPRELATRVVEADASDAPAPAPIRASARRRTGWGPLALSQVPFFEMDRATGGAGLFNTVIQLQLKGDVDPVALRAAIGDVVHRQTILRTVYGDGPEGPVQRVLDIEPPVPEHDLRAGGARALDRFLRREHLTGFDIGTDPAARFSILRTAEDTWSVISTMHHLATDGWSGVVLTAELGESYRRRVTDQELQPPLPTQYLDFARWQQETLVGDRLEGHLDYLAGLLREPGPRITAAATGPATYRTAIDPVALGPRTVAAYGAAARQLRTTPFVTMVAALVSFARARTGVDRQLISTQSANRTWLGSEDLIGCFSNVVHVGATSPAGSVAGLVEQVSGSLGEAVAHEEVPLDHALRLLEQRGVAAADHLPELAFALQPPVDVPIELPGCVLTAQHTAQPVDGIDPTTFPLVVELYGGSGEGLIRRLLDRWPDGSYPQARDELVTAMTQFPLGIEGHAG